MQKGPNGEKRPADVIDAAVKVMKIATGEITEEIVEEKVAGRTKRASSAGQATCTRIRLPTMRGSPRATSASTMPGRS